LNSLIGGSSLRQTVNIASHLHTMAARFPDAIAVVVPGSRTVFRVGRDRRLTFQQLDQDSDRLAAGLIALGIEPQTRAAVMVRPGLDFFSLSFALFKAGVVPVLIDPGMGLRSLGGCLDQAQPEVFIGIRRAVWARRLLGWGRKSIRRVIVVAPGRSWPRSSTLNGLRHLGQLALARGQVTSPVLRAMGPDDTAAILFTSGSTGPPKGAVYTHSIFEAQVEAFRRLYQIESGEVDLCTFPLFALFAPALGMTSIVPDMDPTRPARVDPDRIFQAMDRFQATNLFGSPALLRRIAPAAARMGRRFPSLKRVVTAGAPVSPGILDRFAGLLDPPSQIFTPYGATEALPISSIGSREILSETRFETERGAGVCVGRPVPGIDVRIIVIRDDAIPLWSNELLVADGDVGEIVVAGPVVTREYFRRPEATALAKIADPSHDRILHRMGDLGYLDAQGRLWFCGRKSHRVILEDRTLFTICVEGVFNSHPAIARTALVGVTRQNRTIPVLCVETNQPASRGSRRTIRRELLELASTSESTQLITTILFHPSFPVDVRHNSKIYREKLAVWAAGKLR
jgi:acyl-CoA synthetase (AMP-forming)/AMP-acid ligase II